MGTIAVKGGQDHWELEVEASDGLSVGRSQIQGSTWHHRPEIHLYLFVS
jgi:hypothetical protein